MGFGFKIRKTNFDRYGLKTFKAAFLKTAGVVCDGEILELKEKMSGKGITIDAPELKDEADALEALVSLGYTQKDARDALANVSESNAGVENRVKAALKKLGKA